MRRWSERALTRAAAGLSLAAGVVHGGLAPAHFDEWWGYGLFFVGAATAQVVFGLALLTDAVNPRDAGPRWRGVARALYAAGVAGNLAVVALYVVTRTVGIPVFGPEAGEVEAVAPIDLVSKALEIALVATLAVLLARGAPAPREA